MVGQRERADPFHVVSLSPYDPALVASFFEGRFPVTVEVISEAVRPAWLRQSVVHADLVIGDHRNRIPVDGTTVRAMRRCRLIQQPSAGIDAIDVAAAAAAGVPVANAAGYNADAVADWAVMAMLCLIRDAPRLDRRMRCGEWRETARPGRELASLVVGIVGLGSVGRALAARLTGFGPRLVFSDVECRAMSGAVQLPLDELVQVADVVSVHVPHTPATERLFGRERLGRMRPGSWFVNAARGRVVDEAALVGALESGRLAGAALDVFAGEPPDRGSALRRMENVLLSPHWAGTTAEAESRVLRMTGENLRRALEGAELQHVVNGVRRGRLGG